MTETRKLAAILVADVVGFCRLAGADEERLLARLRVLRSDLIDPTIAVHKGSVVKRTGDGAIVERSRIPTSSVSGPAASIRLTGARASPLRRRSSRAGRTTRPRSRPPASSSGCWASITSAR